MKHFNQYAQYPEIKGLIIGRDEYNNHLITMGSKNIRNRISQVDKDNKKGRITFHPKGWSLGRVEVLGSANRIIWQYIEMPKTPLQDIYELADTLDKESVSTEVNLQLKTKKVAHSHLIESFQRAKKLLRQAEVKLSADIDSYADEVQELWNELSDVFSDAELAERGLTRA